MALAEAPAPSPAEGRTGAQGGAEWGSLRWAVLGSALPVPPTGPAREGRRPRTAGLPRAQGKSWGPRHIRQSTGVAPRGPAQGEGGAFPVRGQRPATHPGSPSDGLSGQHGGRRCVPSGCRGPRQQLRSLSGLRAPGSRAGPRPGPRLLGGSCCVSWTSRLTCGLSRDQLCRLAAFRPHLGSVFPAHV